jgi:hypothetical protein
MMAAELARAMSDRRCVHGVVDVRFNEKVEQLGTIPVHFFAAGGAPTRLTI